KEESRFPLNSTTQDGLHYYCKRCALETARKSRGLDDELTTLEQSILLKYLPYAHRGTDILTRKPASKGKDDSIPLTLTDISREESRFPLNSTTQDGLHYYCKRCALETARKSRGLDDELTTLEQSILLKYLPYAHRGTDILTRKPASKGKDDSIPLTLTDISR